MDDGDTENDAMTSPLNQNWVRLIDYSVNMQHRSEFRHIPRDIFMFEVQQLPLLSQFVPRVVGDT
jgi:hypothetical protein